MNVSANRQILADLMGIVAGVVNKRHSTPILQNVLFDASDDGLILRGTDGELSIQERVPEVGVKEPGSLLLSAARLSGLLRDLRSETVTITTEGDQVLVSAGSDTIRLQSTDPEGFPSFAEFKGDEALTLNASQVDLALSRTGKSIAVDKGRYALNGVLMTPRENRIEFCGTDGRRLAYVCLETAAKEIETQVILPRRGIEMLQKLSQRVDENEPVKFDIRTNELVAKVGDSTLSMQLVNGEYPDYHSVIPKGNEQKAVVNRQALAEAVRLAKHTTSIESAQLSMAFNPNEVALKTRASGVGSSDIKVELTYAGPEVKLGFDPGYLSDGLALFSEDDLTIEFQDINTGAIFHAGDAEHFLYLVMPMDPS